MPCCRSIPEIDVLQRDQVRGSVQDGLNQLLLLPEVEFSRAQFFEPLFQRECHDIKKLRKMLDLIACVLL